jgi:hypothetical protein
VVAAGKAIRPRRLGTLTVALLALVQAGTAERAAADVGYQGPQFTANAVSAPTGQKPQSKLWFNDGSWWGSLFVPGASAEQHRIHRLDPVTQTWRDTGTALDDRNSSEADILWDGIHLYVASSSDTVAGIRLFRYSYNRRARRYRPDSGFPVEIGTGAGPTEGVVLAKDTARRLWITFAREGAGNEDGRVYVAHSSASENAWTAPFALPFPQAANITADDISAIVAFERQVGVMWSNQTDQKIYFATHADGDPDTAWTLGVALEGPLSSDDHLNLKSLQTDPAGRVFAVVKTSLDEAPMPNPGSAQVLLLVLGQGGWTQHVFGTVANDHTRPIVLTDQRRRRLYVFATSPTLAGAGVQTIYYKETSLDNPSFAPGPGRPFIQSSAGDDVNDPTSTKQDLGRAPSLVVLASDNAEYWHNVLDRARPVLRRLSLRPFAFRAGRRARLRFSLSEQARVIVRVERRRRARRGRRFRHVRLRGRFSVNRRAGRNTVRFRGRLRGRALRPGRYRLVLVAVDAARNRSRTARIGFRVVR